MNEWSEKRIIIIKTFYLFLSSKKKTLFEALDEITRLQNEISVRDSMLEQMANETGNEIKRLRIESETSRRILSKIANLGLHVMTNDQRWGCTFSYIRGAQNSEEIFHPNPTDLEEEVKNLRIKLGRRENTLAKIGNSLMIKDHPVSIWELQDLARKELDQA